MSVLLLILCLGAGPQPSPTPSAAPTIPSERARARVAALVASCDAGKGADCSAAAMDYATGRGVAVDKARSIALYGKACDAGDGLGCQRLGTAYASLFIGSLLLAPPASKAFIYFQF